ncbi:MAG: hypothetical protein ACRENK_04825 [Gemmatimonadaceae bacterium]
MDPVKSRIAQAYGYAVCFITVVVMLAAIKTVVDASFDLSDPIRAENGGYGRMGRPLTNFELYKIEARKQAPARAQNVPSTVSGSGVLMSRGNAVTDSSSSDAELHKLYDAEREDLIANQKFHATRSLVGSILVIVLAGVLFAIHWRWLTDRDVSATPQRA